MELKINTSPAYTIKIGNNLIPRLKEFTHVSNKVMVVTDKKVHSFGYMDRLDFDHDLIVLDEGENTKSFENVQLILAEMLDKNYTRSDTIIAFGGGVIGDLVGFVASMYMRGMNFIQIPTTLLSQVDSSVGGKTAVNFNKYKNMVGAFYQPRFVLIDTDTLNTLDIRQFNNGMAEVIKYGCILDKELFEYLKEDTLDIEKIIYTCLDLKRQVVEEDEKEKGVRKILNFGHTFGHGIESYYQFKKYYHGECVAIGMMEILKNSPLQDEVKVLLEKYDLPTEDDYNKAEVFELMKSDKKAGQDNHIDIILLEEIGKYKIQNVSFDELERSF